MTKTQKRPVPTSSNRKSNELHNRVAEKLDGRSHKVLKRTVWPPGKETKGPKQTHITVSSAADRSTNKIVVDSTTIRKKATKSVSFDSDTTSTVDSSSSTGSNHDSPVLPEERETLRTQRAVPLYLMKQKSVVTKWNKFAAMEEDGIPAAPRHRTKVVKALAANLNANAITAKKTETRNQAVPNTTTTTTTRASPLRPNLLDAIRQQDHQLKSVEQVVKPSSPPTKGTTISPTLDLLAGIKAGVNLKHVETPKKDANKETNQSPTSALLAKLQARKKECLLREQESSSSSSGEDDDW